MKIDDDTLLEALNKLENKLNLEGYENEDLFLDRQIQIKALRKVISIILDMGTKESE